MNKKACNFPQHVVDQCVEVARQICCNGNFNERIILDAIKQCSIDLSWLRAYKGYVEGDPYKHGNPRKNKINPRLGKEIRIGIGGVVKEDSNGKRMRESVKGEVIQSYTLMECFNRKVVCDPDAK